MAVEDFLNLDLNKKVILNVILTPLPSDRFTFKSYKIMPRAQNAHAFVNAAFLTEAQGGRIKSANICFGGINPRFSHAIKTEALLIGKDLYCKQTLSEVIKTLQNEISSDWVLPDVSPEYRNNLAISLFYKFVLATCPPAKLSANVISGGEILQRALSSGDQTFDTNKDRWPITQPVEKIDGIVQTAGEAQYVNDIPHFPGQLWAAFVSATEVHATISAIDPAEALSVPGVRYFFSAKDIPGNNNFTPTTAMMINEVEEIFCDGAVKYHGQPVGIILADTFELASYGAGLVKVHYRKSGMFLMVTLENF